MLCHRMKPVGDNIVCCQCIFHFRKIYTFDIYTNSVNCHMFTIWMLAKLTSHCKHVTVHRIGVYVCLFRVERLLVGLFHIALLILILHSYGKSLIYSNRVLTYHDFDKKISKINKVWSRLYLIITGFYLL